jgi:hypothetical protein
MALESVDNGFRQTDGTDNRLFIGGEDVPVGVDGNSLAEVVLNVTMADVSTAASVWVVSPYAGTIVGISSVIDGTIATAPAVLTAKIATVSVTDGVISILDTSSAAGDVDTVTPTAANVVTAGQAIEVATSGASTNTVIATISITIRRS